MKNDLKSNAMLLIAIFLFCGAVALLSPTRANAAGGVIKGDYSLHSHGGDLFLLNGKTGAVYRWLGEEVGPGGVKWKSERRSSFDDGYL